MERQFLKFKYGIGISLHDEIRIKKNHDSHYKNKINNKINDIYSIPISILLNHTFYNSLCPKLTTPRRKNFTYNFGSGKKLKPIKQFLLHMQDVGPT